MAKSAKKNTLAKERQKEDDSRQLASAWSPLREPVFRALWIATVVSNIGSWMQDVGEAWLMTSLTTSPVLVALVETAGSLPVVLMALPAGAADAVGGARAGIRRRAEICDRPRPPGGLGAGRDAPGRITIAPATVLRRTVMPDDLRITAAELHRRMAAGEKFTVVDTRTRRCPSRG